MAEDRIEPPIPVLVVGEAADRVVGGLVDGLARAGQGTRFAVAAFKRAEQATDASSGATSLVVIAVGPTAETILTDPCFDPWRRHGMGLARIAVEPESESGAAAASFRGPLSTTDVIRVRSDELRMLPVIVPMAARVLRAEQQEEDLRRRLATEQACVPLAACLDPGKLYAMTLEILLRCVGRQRGITLFMPSPAPRGAGVATRGFEDPVHERLCQQLIEEKVLDASVGGGEVSVVPFGALHHVLGRVGIESPGALLSVPLSGNEHEVGNVWVLSDDRRFDEADLAAARVVATRASAALSTAERYHHAKERAFIDDVTGVYNARYLLSTADNEIQRAARYGRPLSLLFLDLDRFKIVNDRYGHLVGSETLRLLSGLLGQCVRQVDTLARYGGDEFTILLVDTSHETALQIAERIRRTVESHLFEAGHDASFRLTISIGVATCPDHAGDREALLDAADKAMYRAKSDGRNRVCSTDDLRPVDRRADAPSSLERAPRD